MADPEVRTYFALHFTLFTSTSLHLVHLDIVSPGSSPAPEPPSLIRTSRLPPHSQVAGDQKLYKDISMKLAELTDVVNAYLEYTEIQKQSADTRSLMKEDPDMAEMAKEELAELEQRADELEAQLTVLLLPSDPLDNKNIMLEARAAAVTLAPASVVS